jgi:hypothetical protein
MLYAGGRRDLHKSFNYWAKHRQFIIANEATQYKTDAERLKSTITESTIWIDTKNVHAYEIDNRFNILFTTNKQDSLAIDETDRRFLILQFPDLPEPLVERLIALRDDPLTPGALRWYYENKVNLSAFNPGAKAPMTEAKQLVIDSNRDETTSFAQAVRDRPRETLTAFYRAAMTNEDLLAAYDNTINPRIRSMGEAGRLRKALGEAGLVRKYCPADAGSLYKSHWFWFIDPVFCRSKKVRELNDWYCKDTSPSNASVRKNVIPFERPSVPTRNQKEKNDGR